MRRREFLTFSAASGAVAATGSAMGAAAALWDFQGTPPLSRAGFLAYLNREFHVSSHGGVRAAVAAMVAVKDGPAHPGLEQFSVLFHGRTSLPTGLCWVTHADGTRFSLYLDDAPCMGAGTLRRATFSLLERRDV
jgi:hypothetical protein